MAKEVSLMITPYIDLAAGWGEGWYPNVYYSLGSRMCGIS